MRENFRERFSASTGKDSKEDFRDNLFSIFVDNLHLKVDYECLWGLFKPFGKVRDIYLSAEKIRRRSRFAFVRFGTQEEASKVAATTNGMHMYGWPIATKVAARGWKNKSFNRERQWSSFKEDREFQRKEANPYRSYVDAVRGSQAKGDSRDQFLSEKMVSMSWDFRKYDKAWLNRCAIGILKEFKEVSLVCRRLSLRDIAFSSLYLGDKSVLWTFESEFLRDRFIADRGEWGDCFSSMVRWSDSLVVQARLVWINCWGIPLSYWSPEFFMKLGWQVGEPLCVDSKTRDIIFFEKGRVLVLIPHKHTVSVEVKIVGGSRPFVVKLEEDRNPMDFVWVENLLALSKEQSKDGRKSSPMKEKFQICWPKEVGEVSSKLSSRVCQREKVGKTAKSGWTGTGNLEKKNRGVVVRRLLEKGKKKYFKKTKGKVCSPLIQNGAVILEKRIGGVRAGGSSSVDTTSSSDSDVRKRVFLESTTERGGCSRVTESDSVGLSSYRPKKVSWDISSGPGTNSNKSVALCVDLGPLKVSPVVRKDSGSRISSALGPNVVSSSLKPPILSGASSDSIVQATLAAEIEAIT
ncbi:hypothetical protein LWI29_030135 [Acer saccharum]|uniref:RRM domain-containing protein n=1 Tax=Acer saccharum TaxID=4024 RepID=A0AA39T4L6_ACESA|nr:hypothetical protein LWI29_030135 [Acer saccharum]